MRLPVDQPPARAPRRPVGPVIRLAVSCVVAALALLAPRLAPGQMGSGTDIIIGTVTGPDGAPLAGARVEVTSIETGITRTRTTNDKGQYTLLFPDGGGQYRVTVRFLGMAPQQLVVARQADEDRLLADAQMSSVPTQLQTVQVQASRAPRADDRPTPGSVARTMTGEQLQRLPIDPSDPNAIALLAPGVVAVGGSDTTAAGFSVAGQRPDQNQVTLDGLSFGDATVPQEAVRSSRVVTSTYDIARGQFTGGMVQTTTRGGTNQLAGSASYSLRDPSLQWADEDGAGGTFSQGYTQHQLSGGLGGPVVKDKLFYFGSLQLRRRLDPLQSLLDADALTLERLGASADSAARFRELLAGYELPLTVPSVPDDRLSSTASGLARMDYQLGENHSLMVRGNAQGSRQEGFRIGALSVPSSGGKQTSWSAGGMVTLSSVLGNFLNEARAFYSHSSRAGDPYVLLPEGRVRVSSSLDNGATGITTLGFGGNTALPTEGYDAQLEVTDELSWLSGRGGHRFKLGGLFNYSAFSTASGNNRYGSFAFNSLDALAANRPASFTRSLTSRQREGAAVNSAVYLGDVWRRSRSLQLTYGVRLEHSDFLGAPAHNPEVERLFGRRTDEFPAELHLSPRVGFTWTLGLPEPGREQGRELARRGAGRGGRGRGGQQGFGGVAANATIIRGGIGEFRGRAPTQIFASAIDATGLAGGELQLVCTGTNVPTPDWAAYRLDPSTIPTQCADGAVDPIGNRRPSVTVFDPDFGAPRSWRASLGASRRVAVRYGVNLDASYALGTNLYGARDLNLSATPRFTLAAEGNRPVYVPAASIDTASGATNLFASRVHPQFAQVVEAMSELRSHTGQVTAGVSGVSRTSMIWNLSYTYTRSTDQTSFAPSGGAGGGGRGFGAFGFGVGSSTTAGNPNAAEWGTSDLERRHALLGSLNWFVRPWLDVTSIVRLASGTPFTPRVGGDVNGDGSRNDRAYVFDPAAAPDTAVANGMARLLAGAPERARDCLRAQLGRIASRNSCASGWTPSLDLQMNLRPNLGRSIGRRLNLMVSFVNPLAGLDQLLHGSDDLRGWGQPSRPDATLLYVRGFDAAQQRFVYQVNERFGDTRGSRTAIRNPFQVGIQARLQIGPDRQREMLMGMLGALGGRGGGGPGGGPGGGRPGAPGGPGAFDIRRMIDRVAPNPATLILGYRDTLQLSTDQEARLTAIGDSLGVQTDSLAAQLSELLQGALRSGAADPGTIFRSLQPKLQEARDQYLAALARMQAVLTPEQWQRLPDEIRNPRLPRAPGERRRPE